MFIASLICLILGILLLIASVVLFIKLDVKEAWAFIRNKRSGKKTINYSASRKRKRHNLSNKQKPTDDTKDAKHQKTIQDKIEERVSDKDVVKTQFAGSNTSTYEVEESEEPTGLLEEESEQPTGLLEEDSENPTGLLEEESEQPTGLLEEDSESPTGLLDEEESEQPTGLLEDESESPTGLLDEDSSEEPTGLLDKNKIHKKPKSAETYESDFKFEIVKDEVIVHTDETIN